VQTITTLLTGYREDYQLGLFLVLKKSISFLQKIVAHTVSYKNHLLYPLQQKGFTKAHLRSFLRLLLTAGPSCVNSQEVVRSPLQFSWNFTQVVITPYDEHLQNFNEICQEITWLQNFL